MTSRPQVMFHGRASVLEQVAAYVRALILRDGMRPGDPLPSYREISAQLGVAYLTVKRAMDMLANEGLVVRHRGRGCVLAHDPSTVPRTLKKLGLIFSLSRDSTHPFAVDYTGAVVLGIMTECHRLGLDAQMFSLNPAERISPAVLADNAIDGIIFVGVENEDYLCQAASWRIPVVVADFYSRKIPLEFVACDNAGAARTIVQHLLQLGHRRIGYAGGPARLVRPQENHSSAQIFHANSSDVREREAAVLRNLRAANALVEEAVIRTTPDGAQLSPSDVVQAWFAAKERPTAIITYSETLAHRLLGTFRAEGVHVPRDVSVAAVAGSRLTIPPSTPVTVCRFDFHLMGTKTVRILHRLCVSPRPARSRVHRIPFEFSPGETTAPPQVLTR